MSIFIGYESALECLRSEGFSERAVACRAFPKAGCVPQEKDVIKADLALIGVKQQPVCLVVADAAARGRSKLVTCHVWSGHHSAKSFVRMGDDLYVSSPEGCFLQLATELSLARLILVGLELCGTYALDEDEPDGFRSRDYALTTVAALRRYVLKAKGVHGRKRAMQALRFVVDGSASPMESVLAMLLCLPTSFGGYGLPLPYLNYSIKMPDDVRRSTGRAWCVCDLCWPDAKVAAEYESDLHHSGAEDVANDSKRRAALDRVGYTVVTVTWAQVRDARALDEVARVLAKHVGKRFRCSRSDWLTRRYDLRTQILPTRRAGATRLYSSVLP